MEFKVGDRVRIRQWEDMEKEFGTDSDGDIRVWARFVKGMRHLCGRTAIITEIYGRGVKLDFDNKTGDVDWGYTTDMIEKAEEPKEMTMAEIEAALGYPVKVVK